MHTIRIRPALLALPLIPLTACAEPVVGPTDSHDEPAALCQSDVFVGRVADGCDASQSALDSLHEPPGWEVEALGKDGLMAELCTFRWTGDGPVPKEDLDPTWYARPSCPVVTPQGVQEDLRKATYDAFRDRIGMVQAIAGADQSGNVSTYVVDTHPAELPDDPRSPHGQILRDLLIGLLCEESCEGPITIHSALGLPLYHHDGADDYDDVRGGTHGRQIDLARGILAAVEHYENSSEKGRIVVNLAVGWEPVFKPKDGDTVTALLAAAPTSISAEEQAVLLALARASCQGAMIMAAAGNETSEPCTTQEPMGPALFKVLTTPSKQECAELGLRSDKTDDHSPIELVMSFAHVGLDGLPLPGHRPDPLFVAQGMAYDKPVGQTDPLIGSSVSTTVGAAAVTFLWSWFPKQTRAEIREALVAGGTPIKGSDLAGTPEVSICGAADWLCEASQLGCGVDCPGWEEEAKKVDDLHNKLMFADLGQMGTINQIPVVMASPSQKPNACGATTTIFSAEDFPPVKPGAPPVGVGPQPGSTYCPTCVVKAVMSDGETAKITARLKFKRQVPAVRTPPLPLVLGFQHGKDVLYFAFAYDDVQWNAINYVTVSLPAPLPEPREFFLGYFVEDGEDLYFMREPLIGVSEQCGDGIVQAPEACDDGNLTTMDGCESDCTASKFPACAAPKDPPPCDGDLSDPDPANALRALGICNTDPKTSIMTTATSFSEKELGKTWVVARGFGRHDDDDDPKTPPMPFLRSREGESVLILSTGKISAPGKDGIVIEMPGYQESSDGNNNSLTNEMPPKVSHVSGCDGVKDCSGTIAKEWQIGQANPENRIYFSMDAAVPAGTYSYSFDYAFCTAEAPFAGLAKQYNDLFIAFQNGQAFTGNVGLFKGLAVSVSALNDYFPLFGYVGSDPQLAGTGFEGKACLGWQTTYGEIEPGEVFTLTFYLADMANTLKASVVVLDNFRFHCGG